MWTCECVCTNVCMWMCVLCVHVRVRQRRVGGHCVITAVDISQGLLFAGEEGGQRFRTQAADCLRWEHFPREAFLGLPSRRPSLGLFLIRSLWPREVESLAKVAERVCSVTWLGDEGHCEGCEGTL